MGFLHLHKACTNYKPFVSREFLWICVRNFNAWYAPCQEHLHGPSSLGEGCSKKGVPKGLHSNFGVKLFLVYPKSYQIVKENEFQFWITVKISLTRWIRNNDPHYKRNLISFILFPPFFKVATCFHFLVFKVTLSILKCFLQDLCKSLVKKIARHLMEVISFDKATLLPLSFILNNVLLTHETLDWMKRIGQSTIFLGLIFWRPITISFETFYSKPWRNLACLHKWSLWLRLFFQMHKLWWISMAILQISLTLERV